MKPSIGSVTFADSTFEEMMRRSVRAGFLNLELVCIPDWIHVDLHAISPGVLRERIQRAGMELVAIYPGGVQVEDNRPASKSIDYIKRACDAAAELGVTRIVFTGCARETPIEATIAGLDQIVASISGSSTRICLENHYQNRIETRDDYRAILRAIPSPNLGITIDTGHFTSSKIDAAEFVQEFAAKIYHVHLKDHIGTRSVAIGTGETPNASILAELRNHGYDGYVSLELEVEDPVNIDRYAADAWVEMQSLLRG